MSYFSRNKQLFSYWCLHHTESLGKSFSRILSNPLEFIFTTLMIAIAFAIPLCMYILFSSAQQLTTQWDGDKQITLFLDTKISLSQAKSLADRIATFQHIQDVTVVDKKSALEEFSQLSGLGEISAGLTENPLPHIIVANPDLAVSELTTLQNLQSKLQQLPNVEQVQFDLLWFQRLQAILNTIKKIAWMISIVLLVAIGLIITNVIRWEVSSRHDEIEIIKLIGGSDAYVRRPFLYSGFWLGITGAVTAFLAVTIGTWVIQQSTKILVALFDSDYQITMLNTLDAFVIFVSASLIGVLSAWIAVTHKLKDYR